MNPPASKRQLLPHALLYEDEVGKVQEELSEERYFYHGTASECLEGIRATGLDPNQEEERSDYPRASEPKAVRFSTLKEALDLSVGLTIRRIHTDYPSGGVQPVLLRVPAAALLGRRFGLDRSYMGVQIDLMTFLKSKSWLTAEEFIHVAQKRGAVSSFDCIPASEIEIFCGDCSGLPANPADMLDETKWKKLSADD